MKGIETSKFNKEVELEPEIEAEIIEIVQRQFNLTNIERVTPVRGGIINETFFLEEAGRKFVLQRLHNMFTAESVADRSFVSNFLISKGWEVPEYISTQTKEKFATDDAGRIYTLYNYIAGVTMKNANSLSESQSFEAGRLLRNFHNDLQEISYAPSFKIEHFRDVRYHMKLLQSMLQDMGDDVRALSTQVLAASSSQDYLEGDDQQLVHGDPKIGNYLWSTEGVPFSIIDFDTLMRGSRFIDIGNLLRSISTSDTDAQNIESGKRVTEVLRGYWKGAYDTMDEREFIQKAYRARNLFSLDICAMYLTDIINNSYFKWDPSQYSSRAAHNFARAIRQWNAYEMLKQP